jgi:acid phosphatase
VQTIVDLLETKGVSWAEYEQDMPSSGYTGNYVNQQTGANDYVRKHKFVPEFEKLSTRE